MNNSDESEPEKQSRKKPPIGNQKSLIKIKKKKPKKKKELFEQLTFVEEHQQTFYIGLNENINGANNPIQAKEIDMEQAEEIAKNWVHPDSQLVRRKILQKRQDIDNIVEDYRPLKLKPLSFLNEPLEISGCIESPNSNKVIKINELFDQVNCTQLNDKDITILSPNRHKVYVEDTPDMYKGLSCLERRMKGLNF